MFDGPLAKSDTRRWARRVCTHFSGGVPGAHFGCDITPCKRGMGQGDNTRGKGMPHGLGAEWDVDLEKILTFQPKVREMFKRY